MDTLYIYIYYITHRIHGAAIYGNIYRQYTPFMLAYIPYMDPMGNIILHMTYEPPVGSIFLHARNVRNGLLAQSDWIRDDFCKTDSILCDPKNNISIHKDS